MKRKKPIKTLRNMIEVKYYRDGSYEWALYEPDTRKANSQKKWRMNGMGLCNNRPTWEEMHKFTYKGLPDPAEYLLLGMMYAEHCMVIDKKKRGATRET